MTQEIDRRRVKVLNLTDRRRINDRLIEGPVFVSPQVQDSGRCRESGCNINYHALIYGVDRVVEADHFHEKSGGIYCFKETKHPENVLSRQPLTGWLAHMETVGEARGKIRAPAVLVIAIEAFCKGCFIEKCEINWINEGIVVSDSNRLSPVCSVNEHSNYTHQARYSFKIEDGQVLFSALT